MSEPASTANTILRAEHVAPPAIRAAQPAATGQGVIDAPSFEALEVDKLFDAVNHASTTVGQAVLYRSLTHPPTEPAAVRAKQDAIRELIANTALRAGVEHCVAEGKDVEPDFFNLLFGTFIGMMSRSAHPLEIDGYGYQTYQRGSAFLVRVADAIGALPTPNNSYLASIFADLKAFRASRAYALMKGPVYRTEHDVRPKSEKPWYLPAIRFRPSLFKPVGLTIFAIILFLATELIPFALELVDMLAPSLWLFILPIALLYMPVVGGFDRDACIYPLRKIFKQSPEVHQALDAFGKLDELLSFMRLKEAFGHPMVLPEVLDHPRHTLSLKDARNPVLAKANAGYVPNDLNLDGVGLTLITGPNSGGKTAFCKTVAQCQLLAQIGSYIPASAARLTPADRIFYQTPAISHLSDGEGRFGTELRRTKEIFIAASSRSLVLMDELSEGTTQEEKIEISMNILDGFKEQGGNTILITHNHELVDRYVAKGVGLAKQVEFRNDQPTYKLIDGVSRVSHADRVAKKIGFSKDDIARYLKGKG